MVDFYEEKYNLSKKIQDYKMSKDSAIIPYDIDYSDINDALISLSLKEKKFNDIFKHTKDEQLMQLIQCCKNNLAAAIIEEYGYDVGAFDSNIEYDNTLIVDDSDSNAGGTLFGSGFSGSVSNSLMKRILAHCDIMLVGSLKGRRLEFNKYHGCCTSGPKGWYNEAGIRMAFWDTHNGTAIITINNTISGLGAGFKMVGHGTLNWADSLTTSQLRPGDVMTLYTGKPRHQHGVMWTGKDWRSDCIQKKCSCYSSSNQGQWAAVLWRHPLVQEPGYTV